jgi:hypothetical protein
LLFFRQPRFAGASLCVWGSCFYSLPPFERIGNLGMGNLKPILIKRLENKGISFSIIPCFIKDLANSLVIDPNMNLYQLNKRLHYLGWDDFDLDYQTLQLTIACFEIEGLKSFEYKPITWFQKFCVG